MFRRDELKQERKPAVHHVALKALLIQSLHSQDMQYKCSYFSDYSQKSGQQNIYTAERPTKKKKKTWVTEELKDLWGNKLAEKATSHRRQRLVFAVQTVFVENPDFQTESAAALYNF